MNWEIYEELSKEWIQQIDKSPEIMCRFMQKGMEKKDTLKEEQNVLAEDILKIIREANKSREWDMLHKLFPPSHDALVEHMEKLEQHIGCVVLTRDGKILFRKGRPEEEGLLYLIDADKISIIENARFAGISWDKEYIGIAYDYGIDVYDSIGTKIGTYSLPDYWIDDEWLNSIISITPFFDGTNLLVVSLGGIYVLKEDDVAMIHDDGEERYDMIHGNVSPDGELIAVGNQESEHIILEYETEFEIWSEIECVSDYAHYAQFNNTGSHILFNSCHMYDGESVIVEIDSEEETVVEVPFKMTAGVSYDEGFLAGTVDGRIVYITSEGSWEWSYYVGSTITGMDASIDGKVLVVATFAGNLHYLQLLYDEAGKKVVSIEEVTRWLVWKNEQEVLRW